MRGHWWLLALCFSFLSADCCFVNDPGYLVCRFALLIERRLPSRCPTRFDSGERQALLDPINHSLMDLADLAEAALLLRRLRRCEMAQARLATQDLALRGDFKPLGR